MCWPFELRPAVLLAERPLNNANLFELFIFVKNKNRTETGRQTGLLTNSFMNAPFWTRNITSNVESIVSSRTKMLHTRSMVPRELGGRHRLSRPLESTWM
jgi:hypothetical protein